MTTHLTAVAAVAAALAVTLLLRPGRGRGIPKRRGTPLRGRGELGDPVSRARPDSLGAVRVPIAGLAALGVSFLLTGPVGWAAGCAVAVAVWRVLGGIEPASVRRRRVALEHGLPHVVDLLACCLSAGASTTAAVDLVARTVPPPLNEELRAVAHRLTLGVEPVQVWTDLRAHPQWGPLGRSLARALESGASVSAAMHRLAEDLRRSTRSRAEARARSVGVRAAAPLGACLLPAFILVGVVPLVAASTIELFSTL